MKAKLCNYAGCKEIINITERYCTKHIHEVKQRIPFANAIRYNDALYKTTEWKRLRKRILAGNPCCSKCGADNDLHVHHITPPRGNEVLFFNEDNLIVVCAACHRTITAGEINGRLPKEYI